MALRTTGDAENLPNPASSSTRNSPNHKHSASHTSSPAPAPSKSPSSSTHKRRNDQDDDAKSSRRRLSKSPAEAKELPAENEAVSQPMSKSASSGSNSNSKDAMSGPSPYGTRSRNRGQTRPNYAEDKDPDVEMYDAPGKKDAEAKKPTRQASAVSADAPRSAPTTSRRAAAAAAAADDKPNGSHVMAAPAKEVNGTHPSPANASASNGTGATSGAGNSKKRKAPAQPPSSSTNGASEAQNTESRAPVGTRRSAAQTHSGRNAYRETNLLSFETHGAIPKDGKLTADDGTVLALNDAAYLVCEPPGEPYYIGRIMEFLHAKSDPKQPVDALRLNWFYRPKDIGKKTNDTRLIYATMHSDISPLTALRGKIQVRHKHDIEDMEAYRKTPDCFWFDKLYDRYIQKYYDVVPCSLIVNVRDTVKKVLDERWKFILVEQGRAKEFTSAVKLCKRCSGYCASNDSVDCAVCNNTYHMTCVRPALQKKPSRGFAWACAACNRAQERRLEARHTPSLLEPHHEADEEEPWDDDEDPADPNKSPGADAGEHRAPTDEQIYQASLWPWRYLGMHCKPEDALDYDDRIYPRASSRLGPKHQATVLPWPGRPVQFVKPVEIRRGKKDPKVTKETLAAHEAKKAANPWVQDEPAGYVARGEDHPNGSKENTATLLWKPPQDDVTKVTEKKLDNYVERAQEIMAGRDIGLGDRPTSVFDTALNVLMENKYDTDASVKKIKTLGKNAFAEPFIEPKEQAKIEEGVAQFGSELHLVSKTYKIKHARVVRFYYTWKKTKRGHQIWGNFSSRKGKKEAKKAEEDANKLRDDVADDNDDSAFDTDKAVQRKRNFMCRFCGTKTSKQWRRAPNMGTTLITDESTKAKDKEEYIAALCRRCGELWRRYGIQWEDAEDLAKKVAAAGSRSWRRKVDEELLKELVSANEMMNNIVYTSSPNAAPATQPAPTAPASQANGTDAPPPRKKLKTLADKEREAEARAGAKAEAKAEEASAPVSKKKEKAVEKPAPPPVPAIPKARILPCAICDQMDPMGDDHLSCKECRLTVHRKCYGVLDNRLPGKWTCDMCVNDKNPQVSIEYRCVLCPVEFTEHDFVEPVKSTHKKKTDKDREKERQDRENAQKAADYWRKRQEDMNRPVNPREPLKRTADNNWVHVTCATFTPEIKFGNAKALSPSEGIPSIPRTRYDEVCKICKLKQGACVSCHHCRSPMHVECARQAGYLLGFEVTPVKGSRRDQHNIVTMNGETGSMSALVWCKEHTPTRTVVHRLHEKVKTPEAEANIKDYTPPNALQFYVQNCKQADLTLTGTVRKANLVSLSARSLPPLAPPSVIARRGSTVQRTPPVDDMDDSASAAPQKEDKVCITCGIEVSPVWYPLDKDSEKTIINGHFDSLGSEAQKFMAQRKFQCHKCKRVGKTLPAPPTPSLPEVPASITPLRPPATGLRSVSPPTHASHAVSRLADMGHAWSTPQAPQPSGLPPAPVAAAPHHAPSGGPPPSLPLAPPRHASPSPMVAPAGPPPQPPQPSPPHHYPSRGPYDDWHRGPHQAPPPHGHHQVNGGPSPPAPIHHSHLRDLRPPPIQQMTHHPQTSPLQHGLGQPMLNGLPPSPPRRGPNSMPSVPSFLSAYNPRHSQPSTPLHHLANGGPPPRPGDHAFSQGLLHQRPAYSPHHSPPARRDSLAMSREPSLTNAHLSRPGEPHRPSENRPPSGASASPSLRNLLS